MNIDFYCEIGSRSFMFSPEDVYGRGVGGAELALISLAEALAKRGNEITIYHDNNFNAIYNGVQYRNSLSFREYNHDTVVLFRNPSDIVYGKYRKLVFWSTDQMTAGNYAEDVFPWVDFEIVISEYHRQDHILRYGIEPNFAKVIDLGVRLKDYSWDYKPEPYKMIYCSIPHRGAQVLGVMWNKIKKKVPEATLVLTGDYSLWGRGIRPGCEDMKARFSKLEGVQFLGNIPRMEMVKHQLTSEVMAYPHIPVNGLPELFCISAAECQVAGAVPVTSNEGAMPTTNEWGIIAQYGTKNPYFMEDYTDLLIDTLKDRVGLANKRKVSMVEARKRFDWSSIAMQWESVLQ